jgi:hypothetical protein
MLSVATCLYNYCLPSSLCTATPPTEASDPTTQIIGGSSAQPCCRPIGGAGSIVIFGMAISIGLKAY